MTSKLIPPNSVEEIAELLEKRIRKLRGAVNILEKLAFKHPYRDHIRVPAKNSKVILVNLIDTMAELKELRNEMYRLSSGSPQLESELGHLRNRIGRGVTVE